MLVLARVHAETFPPGNCCQECMNRGATRAQCDWDGRQHFTCRPGVECIFYERSHGFDHYLMVGYCAPCPVGFYRQLCSCTPCTSEGFCDLTRFYLRTTCTNGLNTDCVFCQTCGLGKFSNGGCNTQTRTQDRVCSDCPSGTYRSSLSVASCSPCRTCDLSLRQRRTACGTVHDRTCVVCPEGSIVTGNDLEPSDAKHPSRLSSCG
jgi:hypothetical protein